MASASASTKSIRLPGGRQYHIDLAPGEVADLVLLVGDPARAELAAGMLDRVDLERGNREYVTYTGTRAGLRLSVMATGIGPDNMEIAIIELCQCVERPTFIRCGSCAGLQPEVRPGDLVVSQAAYRLESTSLAFVGEGYPAVGDLEVLLALVQAADELGVSHHVGLTATAPGFYGAQGRGLPGFPARNAGLIEDLQRQGVKNLEMEISTLFTLASLRGARSGAVCAVFGSRYDDAVIAPADKHALEQRCVATAMRAFTNLLTLDRARGARPHWHPGLGRAR
jgi:uridine phosphorylase